MPFALPQFPMIGTVRQLIDLFTPAQRRTASFLVLLMIGGMVLETLGIGLVIPAVMLLTRSDFATKFPHVVAAFNYFGVTGPEQIIAAGMLVVVAAYLIKTIYIAWLTSREMAFVFRVQAALSERLFADYIHRPYTFHLQRNSSELIRNVVAAINELTLTGLVSLLILATECLVLGGISALLLFVEPVATVIAASFLAVVGFFLNRATRKGIRAAAAQRQEHEAMRIRYLQQALGGIKELKLLGRERGPLRQYFPHNEASARIGRHLGTLQALPKLWLELLAVSGLAIFVLAMVWQSKPLETLIPTIGMFAAAAFRLIPSLNRILGSLQYIRQSASVIETLHLELAQTSTEPEPANPQPLHLHQEISSTGVTVRYPGSESKALFDANFRIPKGTTAGFIGESGAGKSTLVDAILGLLPLESGCILADGVDIHSNLKAWQSSIGYVPQAIYLVDDTIRRNIGFGLTDEAIDESSIRRAVAGAQLTAFVAELPDGLDTVVGERGVRLSGGQRQRIGIARALYHDPPILVLDEATSSLDYDTEAGVMQAIDALHGEKTILIVTHRTSTLDHCDRIFRVENRSVAEVARPTTG